MRGTSCTFGIEVEGRSVRVPVDLTSIKAGSTNPYAFPAVHDWAVAKLTKTIADATPYQLSDSVPAQAPVEFVARGHIDWGDGRRMSIDVEILSGRLMVQHYIEEISQPNLAVTSAISPVFRARG